MAIIRPITAFFTATVAGIAENFTSRQYTVDQTISVDNRCPIDGCCDGTDCDPDTHRRHHSFFEKLRAGVRFACDELMQDLVVWFTIGILLAGAIAVIVPSSFVSAHLGSGLIAYLAMLVAGLPMYICATMSTPIAAALVFKGLSPGAALVFLMAGPATNMATIATVAGTMGKRTLAIYLSSIALCTLIAAYCTDAVYSLFGVSASAVVAEAHEEFVPMAVQYAAAIILAVLMLRTMIKMAVQRVRSDEHHDDSTVETDEPSACAQGCEGPT